MFFGYSLEFDVAHAASRALPVPPMARNQKEGTMTRSTIRKMITSCSVVVTVAMFGAAAEAQTITQVMTGLDSPRGLAFGPEGGLYVTEAGVPANSGMCVAVALGMNCFSETGKVTRLYAGRQERVADGLPSIFNTIRQDVVGPNDISFQGRGGAYVTLGWGGAPAARETLDIASLVGTLIKLEPSGRWRVDANISDFEDANNPAGGPKDSNPYGVLALPGERYVTDAGGNSLLRVAANGDVSLVATFGPEPIIPAPAPQAAQTVEAVPTEVAIGPDGALYVSLLTGAPFVNGVAKVYRVVPGQTPTVFQSNFRAIIDIAFGPDGSLYVLEHSATAPGFGAPGRITRITPDNVRHVINTGTTLVRPTAIVVDEVGAIYVSNKGAGFAAGAGEVLKIVP
jgi:glucose/arabinose dehydrogenase